MCNHLSTADRAASGPTDFTAGFIDFFLENANFFLLYATFTLLTCQAAEGQWVSHSIFLELNICSLK